MSRPVVSPAERKNHCTIRESNRPLTVGHNKSMMACGTLLTEERHPRMNFFLIRFRSASRTRTRAAARTGPCTKDEAPKALTPARAGCQRGREGFIMDGGKDDCGQLLKRFFFVFCFFFIFFFFFC
jgi:hypothetical protein